MFQEWMNALQTQIWNFSGEGGDERWVSVTDGILLESGGKGWEKGGKQSCGRGESWCVSQPVLEFKML